MNVIETLFYIFEADTKKVDEGVDKSSKKAAGLTKELTAADKAGQRLSGTFMSIAKGAGAGLLAGLSVAAIGAMVRNVVDSTDALADQAQALGVSVGELDLWNAAAQSTGGQAGAFAASLATVNERIQDVARKGSPELLAMFEKVGVSLADVKANASDPIALLRQMSDEFANLSEAEAAGLGRKLGLDSGTVNLLRQGRDGLEAVIAKQRELGFVTDAQAEAAGKYNDALDASRRVWDDLRRRFVTAILPALTWVGEKIQDLGRFIQENSTFVVAGVAIIAAAVVGLLLPALVSAATAAWALVAPFLPIIAAVTAFGVALALVVDDLYNFMQGNDSLLGEIAKKWPLVGDIIRGVGETVAHLAALVGEFASAFVTLFTEGPEAALKQLDAGILQVASSLMGQVPLFQAIGDFATRVIDGIVAAWEGLLSLLQRGFGLLTRAGELANGLTGGLAGKALGLVQSGQRSVMEAGASMVGATSAAAVGVGAAGNKTSTVNIDKVEVNTQATDADGISRSIGQSLEGEMRGAADFFDDGVLA